MLTRYAFRSAILVMLFSALGLILAVRPAQASPVQVTLTNLTFGSDSGYGPEVFNGSFFYDPTSNTISGVDITATGATDAILGTALDFFGVAITGSEPYQFAFDDGASYGDYLVLNLASGLSGSSYGFADAILYTSALGSIGFPSEYASSGSFSVAVPTPEPGSLLLLLSGMLLLGLARFARRPSEAPSRG